jgi:hypothetical protein
MDQLASFFADIGSLKESKSRDDKHAATHQPEQPPINDAEDDPRPARARRESRSTRDPSMSTRDPSRSTRREPSRSVGASQRESKDFRDSREVKGYKDFKEIKDANKDAGDPKHWPELPDSSGLQPPPYQEIADSTIPRPVQYDVGSTDHKGDDGDIFPPLHPSGITPTEACVRDAISIPVDWVIHPSAPHFVICGRCYVDRIYDTHQWRREFVKYRPSTGLSLRCHLGAIPHMTIRWSKVHTADEFLAFLKVMQRKKVAKPCPGHSFPSTDISWYTTSSIPNLKICQECRQQLFGGTRFSKHFSSHSNDGQVISSICHGSFNHTRRMVEVLLEDDDWDRFVERMRIRIQLSTCSSRRNTATEEDGGWWYKYARGSSMKELFICEACYFDFVYKTKLEGDFSVTDKVSPKTRCMASLNENLIPDTADVEYSRAEIMRLVHGSDRRCYAQGTVGLKWYTTPSSPWGYGICEGCYQSKVKPRTGETRHFIHKKDVGKRASFACWMNSYHPFFRRHQQLLVEALTLGDISHLESSIVKLSRMPGCQQGGVGQGRNKRWWGWRSLRICQACVKGGMLTETPAGKKFELHGEKDPYHRLCDLYSMQLRDRFHQDDVSKLLELARRRQEVLL